MKSHPLPELFTRWTEEILDGRLPDENGADCGNCVMCDASDWVGAYPTLRFDKRVRCCSHTPDLPNWSVGGVLMEGANTTPRGVATMRRRIKMPGCALPWGVVASTPEKEAMLDLTRRHRFGRAPEMSCPHFVASDRTCSIWNHRNSTCGTWFCRHERGLVGEGFWVAIRELLNGIEHTLAFHAVSTLMPEGDAGSWDAWEGTPESFYKAAHELVSTMSWSDIADEAPPPLRQAVDTARTAYRFAVGDTPIPPNPLYQKKHLMGREAAGMRVEAYIGSDAQLVPFDLYKCLVLFDGRPWQKVVEELNFRGVECDETTIRWLVEFDLIA